MDKYILTMKAKRLWLGQKNILQTISAAVKREAFDRDFNRCVICGIGAGEPYDGEPDTYARLTAGHRTAGSRLGGTTADELQTERSRCNETVNDTPPNPETFGEVMSVVKRLGVGPNEDLLDWLERGYRLRNKTDITFDRARRLSPLEKAEIVAHLRSATKSGPSPTHQRHGR